MHSGERGRMAVLLVRGLVKGEAQEGVGGYSITGSPGIPRVSDDDETGRLNLDCGDKR